MARDDLVGVTVAGKYALKRLIGKGGMGAVFEGEHLEIGKRVAIKVIDPHHATSGEMAARFKREARAASAIESDNIVQVFDAGHDERAGLFMVMEYLVGEDLADRLAREKKLGVATVCGIAHQIASGLAKAHAAGIVHRDLKPANVFLVARDDGSTLAKILDFGIAKFRETETKDEKKPLTRRGTALGTPQYMSPEQAQGQEVDARADVWALGALMYEALAGRPAYAETGSYEATIVKIVTTAAPPLSEVAPHVPVALQRVVSQALDRKLEERIPDCIVFAKRLLEAAPTGASLPPMPMSSKRVVVVPSGPRGAATPITVDASRETQPGPPPATGTGVAVPAKSGASVSPPEPPKKPSLRLRGLVVIAMAGVIVALFVRLRGEHQTVEEMQKAQSAASTSAPPPPEPLVSIAPASIAAAVVADAAAADPPAASASAATAAPPKPPASPGPRKLGESKMEQRF